MRRILIVGGGVIGASVAWHVTARGLGEVVLLERDRLGSGTTFLIGPVEGVDGLYLACAMNSGGVTYSAMAGHGIADWLENRPLRFDEFDCRPSRFSPEECHPARVDSRMPGAPSNFYRMHYAQVS